MAALVHVLIFDGEGTLMRDGRMLPHVEPTLKVLAEFVTVTKDSLRLCVIVPKHGGETPRPRILKEAELHLIQLDHESADMDLDRQKVEATLQGLDARIDECLFITTDAQHAEAFRRLGMPVLQFAPQNHQDEAFADWEEAALLVAQKVNPDNLVNKQKALNHVLARHEIELTHLKPQSARNRIFARALKWATVSLRQGEEVEDVGMPVPIEVEIELSEDGRLHSIMYDEPDTAARAEAQHYLNTLRDNDQLASGDEPDSSFKTHEIITNEEGRKHVTRKGFRTR